MSFLEHPELLLIFFFIASLYASAGFGGGSSYLAVLALYAFSYSQMRSTALLCNIVVVSSSVWLFHRRGLLDIKGTLPLVALSIPAAFIGGTIRIEPKFFFIVLGIALLISAILLWFQPQKPVNIEKARFPLWTGPTIGGGIGFLAGLVGIGGGIFLAPLLHLIGWDQAKKVAAIAALYILVNSIAGFIGQMTNPTFDINWKLALGLVIAVFIGGQIGVRYTISRMNQQLLRRITAALILFVGIRILAEWM